MNRRLAVRRTVMRGLMLFALALALTVALPGAQTVPVKTLDIYVVDVEG